MSEKTRQEKLIEELCQEIDQKDLAIAYWKGKYEEEKVRTRTLTTLLGQPLEQLETT